MTSREEIRVLKRKLKEEQDAIMHKEEIVPSRVEYDETASKGEEIPPDGLLPVPEKEEDEHLHELVTAINKKNAELKERHEFLGSSDEEDDDDEEESYTPFRGRRYRPRSRPFFGFNWIMWGAIIFSVFFVFNITGVDIFSTENDTSVVGPDDPGAMIIYLVNNETGELEEVELSEGGAPILIPGQKYEIFNARTGDSWVLPEEELANNNSTDPMKSLTEMFTMEFVGLSLWIWVLIALITIKVTNGLFSNRGMM